MIYAKTFSSLKKGKNILIFGKIHGNEPCGSEGIDRVINELSNGRINLISGSITFIPVANPQASLENKRFIDENLARIFDNYENPECYEKKISTILATFIKDKDAILDIHSGNAEGSKFVFQDYEEQSYYNLANALGFDMIVHGWSSIYGGEPGGDVTSYAHKFNIPCVAIECGQHNDPDAVAVAESSILRFMSYYGLIEYPVSIGDKNIPLHLMMQKLYSMESEGTFARERKHGDFISEGEIIAKYTHGGVIIAEYDCYIILPKTFARVGDEWFYIAKKM